MKKRILTLLLAITLALGVCTPAVFAGEDNAAVTIIHTTDAHGRTLGYAAIANLVKQHESAGENVADFIQILEDSVREVTEMGGSFLQISGAGYTYDAAKEPGKRISGVTVAGQPIDPAATYTVATNNYVGTTFSKFADYPVLNEYCASDEALISCLAKGAVAFHDETTPRITVLGGIGNDYRIYIDAYLTENDVAPVVSGESVLLPFRAVFELSNYSVSWDGALQTATAAKDASTVSVCYSDGTVAIDGVPVDAKVTMVQDRVLIDSAAIAKALNKAVYVDEFTKSIVLF